VVREEGLDKFYTIPSYSKKCIDKVGELHDILKWDLIVEPSAGNGSFLNQLPGTNKIGIDICPEHPNIVKQDFFDYSPPADKANILVLGNPPFLGKTYQSKEQKADLAVVMHGIHGAGDLDFVCGWYVLAAKYLQGQAGTQAAFVSTNSITQGEQVAVLWGEMHPDGQSKFPHPWPPQIPPGSALRL
jgi:hypothetical protein